MGAVAFAITALVGALWLGADAVAPAIFCGLAIAIVLAVAEALARPERDRNLAALERLADQGRALPEAADAMVHAVERLRQLETSLGEAHAQTIHETRRVITEGSDQTSASIGAAVAEAQRTFERLSDAARASAGEDREEIARVLRHTADRIREDMANGVAQAAKAAQEAVAPVAADAMKKATEAATLHLAEIRESIESDATERRRVQAIAVENLDGHLQKVAARLDQQLEHRVDADGRLLIALEAHARQLREAEGQRAATLAARWQEMTTHLADLEERRGAGFETLSKATAERAAELGERIEALSGTVRASLEQVAKNDEARSERIGALAEQVQRDLGAMSERMTADLGAITEATSTSLEALTESVSASLGAVSETVSASLGAVSQNVTTSLGAVSENVSTTLGTVSENVSSNVGALSERVSTDLGALSERVSTDLGAATSLVRERLEANASAEEAQSARSAELIEQIAAANAAQRALNGELVERIAAAGEAQSARSAELIERFAEAGQAMTQATAAQCAALEAFAQAADQRVEKTEERGTARIADIALRFEAAAEAQQKRLAVFEEELADRQRAGTQALAAHLSEHAKGIDEALRETAGLVREAASLVHAGGGEMAAVAEMFAGAVDKQREAANTWIESLGKIDQAVVEAGEHAAVDVLGNYLARTHELFDQQLGFQQELFEQLNLVAERGAAAAPPA